MTTIIWELEGDEFLYFLNIFLLKDLALTVLSIAKKILMGFERPYQNIKSASIEAKRCFEEKEWEYFWNYQKRFSYILGKI